MFMIDKNSELIAEIKPNGYFELKWTNINKELTSNQILIQNQFYKYYIENIYDSLFFLGLSNNDIDLHESINYLRTLIKKFMIKVFSLINAQHIDNINNNINLEMDFLEIIELTKTMPNLDGCEYLNVKWIKILWDNLQLHLNNSINTFNGNIYDYLSSLNKTFETPGNINFYLTIDENYNDTFPFTLMVKYDKCVHCINNSSFHSSDKFPLKNIFTEYENDPDSINYLLSPLYNLSLESDFIRNLIDSKEIFNPIKLSADNAFIFLNEISLYKKLGINCFVPDFYDEFSNSFSMLFNIDNNITNSININKIEQSSTLNINSIIDFNINLMLGDKKISEEEIKKFLAQKEGLKIIDGKWIKIDHYELNKLLLLYSDLKNFSHSNNLSFIDVLNLKMNTDKKLKTINTACNIKININDYLNSLVEKLNLIKNACINIYDPNHYLPLRPYQEEGVNWLYMMKNLNLGACLADDMGLGKTLEVLALLTYVKFNTPIKNNREKSLLILPASLIENWRSELSRFTPWLKYYIIHPSENKNLFSNNDITSDNTDEHNNMLKDSYTNIFTDYDLIITTYGMVSKYKFFREITWDSLILDEAQAIKNPCTKQTKAIKQLKSNFRIAMTGTPIENHLSDLWSIFDFLNKNLLSTFNNFCTYIKYLKSNDTNYDSLRKIINPFILRRVKTDKSIISDLPKKIEIKTYTTLSKKQIILYNDVVKELQNKLLLSNKDTTDKKNIYRSGVILSTITKLKQICNHPDQYLKKKEFFPNYSGKYTLLKELFETIFENKEQVLIFTQFKEMTKPIKNFLENTFNTEGLVLNGEIPINKRNSLIDKFGNKNNYIPFIVISLKTGGIGLNLTTANHVIHFDRWWNPAVENQATDRAFRIGQEKNVMVHKFITKGTIEERIDTLIEGKIKLSNDIIPNIQEKWITEMNDKEILDMFKLLT